MDDLTGIDIETDIPLSLIDKCMFNPKVPIHGVYRAGLEESLSYFGNRDRIKVWRNPENKTRFICLDGNQRLDVFIDNLLDSRIKKSFGLDSDCSLADLKAVKSDPSNSSKIEKIKKSILIERVPCQVMETLDGESPFTLADAKLFISVYDRNYAKYDEVKQADNYRSALAEKLKAASEETRKALESRVKAMVRPELPVVQPPSSSAAAPNQSTFEFAAPGEGVTEAEPWGPVPPSPQSNGSTAVSTPVPQFVPMVFSLTSEGYREISNSIMRSKARVFREYKLKTALEKLEKIVPDDLDSKIDSVIVETALLILNKHIEAENEVSEEAISG